MKHILFKELISRLRAQPNFARKLKIFVVIGLIGFFTTGALVIWAGVSALGYFSDKASLAMQSSQTTEHIENLKAEAKELSFNPLNCWVKAESLMAIEPWLARSVTDNLKNFKNACLETKGEKI